MAILAAHHIAGQNKLLSKTSEGGALIDTRQMSRFFNLFIEKECKYPW